MSTATHANQSAGIRRAVVAGNWKMNTTPAEARVLAAQISEAIGSYDAQVLEVVLCPPALSLPGVREVIDGWCALGAQNMHWLEQGAFTGEISARMVAELCGYVILGHSERRQHFRETDEQVALKVRAALAHDLVPILCVGESLEQRAAGQTHDWVGQQLRAALQGLAPESVQGLIIAYEPIWAIGTGKAASGADANAVASWIRKVLSDLAPGDSAQYTRILYGGSVTAGNAREYLREPEIDGALVGGASLNPMGFARIVHAAVSDE